MTKKERPIVVDEIVLEAALMVAKTRKKLKGHSGPFFDFDVRVGMLVRGYAAGRVKKEEISRYLDKLEKQSPESLKELYFKNKDYGAVL